MKQNTTIWLTHNIKHCDVPKAFIEYSNDMQDVYENIEE